MEGLTGLEKIAIWNAAIKLGATVASKIGTSVAGKAKTMFGKPSVIGPTPPPLATSNKSFFEKSKDFMLGSKNNKTVPIKNGVNGTREVGKAESFVKDLSSQAKWSVPFVGLSVATSKTPQQLSGAANITKNIGYNTSKNTLKGPVGPKY